MKSVHEPARSPHAITLWPTCAPLCRNRAAPSRVHAHRAHGIDGESGIFFTVYYYLTFTHMVHAFWGILGILWVLTRHSFGIYTADEHSGLEALASYWHATDIIWLVIFPFFYVLA